MQVDQSHFSCPRFYYVQYPDWKQYSYRMSTYEQPEKCLGGFSLCTESSTTMILSKTPLSTLETWRALALTSQTFLNGTMTPWTFVCGSFRTTMQPLIESYLQFFLLLSAIAHQLFIKSGLKTKSHRDIVLISLLICLKCAPQNPSINLGNKSVKLLLYFICLSESQTAFEPPFHNHHFQHQCACIMNFLQETLSENVPCMLRFKMNTEKLFTFSR